MTLTHWHCISSKFLLSFLNSVTTLIVFKREIEEETKESQEKQEKGTPDLRSSKGKPARPVKPVIGNVIKRTEATVTKRNRTKQPQGKENFSDKKPLKKPKVSSFNYYCCLNPRLWETYLYPAYC